MQLTSNVPLIDLDVKVFTKGNNWNFGLCQQTNNVQSMYLALKYLKISSKKGH